MPLTIYYNNHFYNFNSFYEPKLNSHFCDTSFRSRTVLTYIEYQFMMKIIVPLQSNSLTIINREHNYFQSMGAYCYKLQA